jgi:hypothetical protein
MSDTWLIERTEDTVLVTRRKPVRWDVEARTEFPPCHPLRLAHQIRQDLWRELKSLRGFAPAVEINLGDTYRVRAGGRVARHIPPRTSERIERLLENPRNRARWLAWARLGT